MLQKIYKMFFLNHTDWLCVFWPLKRFAILWIGVYWRATASIARDIITVLFQKCCNLLSWDMAFFTKEILERHSLVWTRNNQHVQISLNVFLIDIQEQKLGSRHVIQYLEKFEYLTLSKQCSLHQTDSFIRQVHPKKSQEFTKSFVLQQIVSL